MVLDQIFSHLESDVSSYLHNSTEESLNEMSMDLDDFKFDFDSLSDNLGGWIEESDCKVNPAPVPSYSDVIKSDSIDFKDLNITEAVRYDCMWSSNPANNSISQPSLSENNLLDEFLKLMDANAANFDLNDLDTKQGNLDSPTTTSTVSTIKQEPQQDSMASDRLQERASDVRMYTSLDHCYHVERSLSYDDDDDGQHPAYPITPPESSEDEESQPSSSCRTKPSSSLQPTNHAKIVNIQKISSSQSLLKKVKARSGDAKFCVKVKLSSDPSRSLLKQHKFGLLTSNNYHINKQTCATPSSISSQSKKATIKLMNKSLLQNSIRRRKEESLQLKHDEAREIHNHMERQRRNELKVAFDELKGCMPDIANSEKVSKQMILDTALQNCKLLKSREISLKVRREKLKKSNAELLRKLGGLQNNINTSSSTSPLHSTNSI